MELDVTICCSEHLLGRQLLWCAVDHSMSCVAYHNLHCLLPTACSLTTCPPIHPPSCLPTTQASLSTRHCPPILLHIPHCWSHCTPLTAYSFCPPLTAHPLKTQSELGKHTDIGPIISQSLTSLIVQCILSMFTSLSYPRKRLNMYENFLFIIF